MLPETLLYFHKAFSLFEDYERAWKTISSFFKDEGATSLPGGATSLPGGATSPSGGNKCLKWGIPVGCVCLFIGIYIGVYLSPYVKGVITLVQTAKEAVENPVDPVPEPEQEAYKAPASTLEQCPKFSPFQLYIKK